MNRDTWIPLVGLVGLFLAGTAVLYATSGPPSPPPAAEVAKKQAGKEKAKPRGPTAAQLVSRKPVGEADRPAPPEGARNVVLVVVSAWRKDQLAPYGGPPEVTPWLAEAAREGVRFSDVIAAGGWSKPSLASILTGQHALSLDIVEPAKGPSKRPLPEDAETLAERLAERGWYTMAVNALPHGGGPHGLAQGYDHFRDAHPQGYQPQHRLKAKDAVRIATNMLDRRSEVEQKRPFLLHLNLIDPHKPVKVSSSEAQNFHLDNPRLAPYRTVLNQVDQALARLDEGLEKRGLSENTYVVVVGAIGEGLSQPAHHGHAHGRNVYPSTAQVGWIVRGPDVAKGQAVEGLASHVDVTPTLLGLLGLPSEAGEGRDWSDLVREGGRTTREEAIIDTWYYAANRAGVYTTDRACLKDFGSGPLDGEDWRDACYDRAKDPTFEHPLDDPALMSRLEAWRKQTSPQKTTSKRRK